MTRSLALSGDLSPSLVLLACVLAALSVALLGLEIFRGARGRRTAAIIAVSGVLAIGALLLAVVRPVAILARGTLVGPRVVVLVDASRSIDLPGLVGTRRATIDRALAELDKGRTEVRAAVYAFGDGTPVALFSPSSPASPTSPTPANVPRPPFDVRPMPRSDLGAALEAVAKSADERPSAIVVLSDGRLDRPAEEGVAATTRALMGSLEVPVHTVALATSAPPDASIRAVKAAGAAVAHQPFSLRIELGCDGGLACDEIPVSARELRELGTPTTLAAGTAKIVNGKAVVELSMTLDRAGPRILEIEISPPSGDTIPENNKRYITIDVARDRVRVLHVAGRPTYDVRALRMWLKADASVDVVAFFILRTPSDEVMASQDELALIPFPVDELFSEHLPSFDAVVLQDFDAQPYGLTKHLKSLARYVDKGGGLIMVGGPDSFVPGHYANTPLAEVLPVGLEDGSPGGFPASDPGASGDGAGVDLAPFVPRVTDAGRVAPALRPLRALIGDEWPEMPGTDLVGDARPGTTVLLEHPTRNTKSGAPMPILALGEHESGRTIALTIDGSHRLLFSAFAANAAGRAHGAFWDAMLGWLMRDPRFEPAVVEVPGACIAGEETTLALRPMAGSTGDASIKITRLGTGEVVRTLSAKVARDSEKVDVPVGKLDAGGYSITVQIAKGAEKSPTTRRDFACEKGGDEWADSRPDVERLRAISAATGGTYVVATDAASLPLPPATQVTSERRVAPILPPWAWTLTAAMLLGVHWISRRRGGLS